MAQDKVQKAIDMITNQASELREIVERTKKDEQYDAAFETLGRWKDRTIRLLSEEVHTNEGKRLADKKKTSFIMGDPLSNLADEASMYLGFLRSLVDELEKHPEDVLTIPIPSDETESKTAVVSEAKDSVRLPLHIFDTMQFHPKVIEASRKLFKDGHYRDAILRAFIEVNNFVKAKTGLELDGKALMTQVFRKENPVIQLNESKTQSEKDEQEGFMFLFMGAMIGIRNPKAHDNIVQTDPLRTLEYLSVASLLMRRADEGTLRPKHLKS